jgi:hypothetical protein
MPLEAHIELTDDTGEEHYVATLSNQPGSPIGVFPTLGAAVVFIRDELFTASFNYYFRDLRNK